jgi:hypothetical protein
LQHAYQWLQRTAQALKLVLHPEKTRIVDLRYGANGFDFPGFSPTPGEVVEVREVVLPEWPSGRAMAAIRAKVKATTAPRSRLKQPIGNLVAELNPVLRGLPQIDAYVWERLALFDSKKRQHAERRWGEEHAYAWVTGLGVYRLSGTIRYTQSATVRLLHHLPTALGSLAVVACLGGLRHGAQTPASNRKDVMRGLRVLPLSVLLAVAFFGAPRNEITALTWIRRPSSKDCAY